MTLINYELEIILRALGSARIDLEHVNNSTIFGSNLDEEEIVLVRTLSGMRWQVKLV